MLGMKWDIPKAPFSVGSTDEILDDKVNGLTTQSNHSKGDIVVTGNELVTNGTFDTDTSGWDTSVTASAIVTVTNGVVKVENGSNAPDAITYSMQLIGGVEYILHGEVLNVNGVFGQIAISTQNNATQGQIAGGQYSANTTHDIKFTPSTSGTYYVVIGHRGANTTGYYAEFDNISVKLADQSYIATRDTVDMYDYDYKASTIPFNTVQNNTVILNSGGTGTGVIGNYYLRIGNSNTLSATNANLLDTANWIDLGTSTTMSLQNPYFKAIPYVTKQVALLVEKTSAGAILNTVKPLVNCYGEESVETYEADIFAELGYSQLADRVWSDGSSEFILLGLKGYLNAGAYHPWYNEFGTRKFYDSKDDITWYGTIASNISSSYICFTQGSVYSGVSLGYVDGYDYAGGFISAASGREGRPDSKFYDKCYINGQGGLICYAIPNALTPTYKHQEEVKRNLVDGYVENGVETNYVFVSGVSTTSYINLGATKPIIYDALPLVTTTPTFKLKIGNDDYYITEKAYADLGVGLSYYARVGYVNGNSVVHNHNVGGENAKIYNKSPYLATQGSTTHTDLIGDPANYPQDLKNRLASGKGVGFMNSLLVGQDGSNLIPDGTSKNTIYTKKSLYSSLSELKSSDSGDTWLSTGRTVDTVKNLIVFSRPTGEIALQIYQAQNQAAIPITTPKPIEYVDRDLIASNSHSVYAYNGLTYAGTGKVATGAVVESKGVDDVVYIANPNVVEPNITVTINGGDIIFFKGFSSPDGLFVRSLSTSTTASFSSTLDFDTYAGTWDRLSYEDNIITTPTHNTISLDANSRVGSKALITQTSDATQVFTQEMIYNVDWGDTDSFDALTDTTTANLNGDTVQHKVLLKPSSVRI